MIEEDPHLHGLESVTHPSLLDDEIQGNEWLLILAGFEPMTYPSQWDNEMKADSDSVFNISICDEEPVFKSQSSQVIVSEHMDAYNSPSNRRCNHGNSAQSIPGLRIREQRNSIET